MAETSPTSSHLLRPNLQEKKGVNCLLRLRLALSCWNSKFQQFPSYGLILDSKITYSFLRNLLSFRIIIGFDGLVPNLFAMRRTRLQAHIVVLC